MSDAPTTGHNGADAELKRRIDRRVELLDQLDDLKDDLKTFKAEDKADGYVEKAIAATVKSRRADPETYADQLALEALVDTYRRAAGLEVDLDKAQAKVRAAVAETPEKKSRERRRRADLED